MGGGHHDVRDGRIDRSDQNPFVGLAAFQEADADRFYGRDRDIQAVLALLRRRPLVAIAGPSGAGKSSLVRAGVIPALKRSGEGWDACTVRPGRAPLTALAEVLQQSRSTGDSNRSLKASVAMSLQASLSGMMPEGLASLLEVEPGGFGARLRAQANARKRKVVLLVDQFEELYTQGVARDERAAFLACLSGAADDPSSPVRVIVTMRSDFLDRLIEDGPLGTELARGLMPLSPLGRDCLRLALTAPLATIDVRFESDELVERMVDQLDGTPSALPLLQFTAAALWEQRDVGQRVITAASYEQVGGVAGALAAHADAVLSAMSARDARLARAVFLRAVTPERTRALTPLVELRQLDSSFVSMERVLGRLIESRLLTVTGTDDSDAANRIWPADGRGEPVILNGHDQWVNTARFSPDGTRIVSASDDATIRIWRDLQPVTLDDPRLWTLTNYCMPIARRIELLGVTEQRAEQNRARCLQRVADTQRASGQGR